VKSIQVLQHTACETLGTIEDVLRKNRVDFRYVRTQEGERVPHEMGEAAGLIVMGGPMGVYDSAEFPFLRDEMRLLESALKAEKPILGVCLGSQLLAAALGAEVKKGERKELGWHAISLAEEAHRDSVFSEATSNFTPFHWHGDVFDLPSQAVRLASSQWTLNQAFRYGGNAYGILFHLEVNLAQITQMLIDFADELRQAGGEPARIRQETSTYLPTLEPIASTAFDRWVSLL
jgi:GMP synthase (glutamine-hydrolysing)